MRMLGWWWTHTGQDERAAADRKRKAGANKPPTPRRVTGGPARRVRSR
jgi:hypothetical protein